MRRAWTMVAMVWLGTNFGCGDDGDGSTSATGADDGTGASSGTTNDPGSTSAADPSTGDDSSGSPTTTPTSGSTSSADDTGGPATGTDDTGGGLCPDIGEPCTMCESTQCPDEYCGCYDNGSCLLLAQCAAACDLGDEACNQACWTQYPDGISDGALLTHCAATLCMAECGPYEPLTPCQVCLYDECSDAMNVCIANPECTQLLQCVDACDFPGCENTCYTAYPDGLADSGPVATCAMTACTAECA